MGMLGSKEGVSTLIASGRRERTHLLRSGLMVFLYPDAPPFPMLRGCICSLEKLGNPEVKPFINGLLFPDSLPHSPTCVSWDHFPNILLAFPPLPPVYLWGIQTKKAGNGETCPRGERGHFLDKSRQQD